MGWGRGWGRGRGAWGWGYPAYPAAPAPYYAAPPPSPAPQDTLSDLNAAKQYFETQLQNISKEIDRVNKEVQAQKQD